MHFDGGITGSTIYGDNGSDVTGGGEDYIRFNSIRTEAVADGRVDYNDYGAMLSKTLVKGDTGADTIYFDSDDGDGDDNVTVSSSGTIQFSTIHGNDGNDSLYFDGNNIYNTSVLGDEGNDTIRFDDDSWNGYLLSASSIQGGAGNDSIRFDTLITGSFIEGNDGSDTIYFSISESDFEEDRDLVGQVARISTTTVLGGDGNDFELTEREGDGSVDRDWRQKQ